MHVSVSWRSVSESECRESAAIRQGAYTEGAELCVWVLVANAALERAHSLLGVGRLGSDNVGDFKVERDVLPGAGSAVSICIISLDKTLGILTSYC